MERLLSSRHFLLRIKIDTVDNAHPKVVRVIAAFRG